MTTYLIPAAVIWCLLVGTDCLKNRFYDEFSHPCIRECSINYRRFCEYDFSLEWYYILSKACFDCPRNKTDCARPHCATGDGMPRAIMSVNRQLPGPSIQVCEGDVVVVRVHNRMEAGEGTSIHWHGLHQYKTPWMDGVSKVTQCPITSSSSFEYRFLADPAGTHFWHAHTGLQRSDGIFGNLVIRQDHYINEHIKLYDKDLAEHVIMIHDWSHMTTTEMFAKHHHAGGDNKPESLLVNGKGVFKQFSIDGKTYYTPRAMFKVTKGLRYRFRIVSNAILYCPVTVSVEDHDLLVIASDGAPLQPFMVNSFIIYGGERFDFIVAATKSVKNYLMKFQGVGDCGEVFTRVRQSAILHYIGSDITEYDNKPNPPFEEMGPRTDGIQLNPHNYKADDLHVPVSELNGTGPALRNLDRYSATPDHVFYAAFDFEKIDNGHFHDPEYYPISVIPRGKHLYSTQINGISLLLPPSPVLYQYDDLDKTSFCQNNEQDEKYFKEFHQCPHILEAEVGQLIEIILIDKGRTFNASHPFHLHGQYFKVVALQKVASMLSVKEFKDLDAAGQVKRRYDGVLKDTVVVPDGGYTVIRFLADNPGVWFFHCHLEFHAEIGMGLLFNIGKPSEWPTVPDNFERCGAWKATYSSNWTLIPNRLTGRKGVKSLHEVNYATVTLLTAAFSFLLYIQLRQC